MQRSNMIRDLNRALQERPVPSAVAETPSYSSLAIAHMNLDLLQRSLPETISKQLLVEAIMAARLTYAAPAVILGAVLSYNGNSSQANDGDNIYAYKDNMSISENYGFVLHNQINLDELQLNLIVGLLSGILATAKKIIGSPTGSFSSNVATSAERLAAEAVVESVMEIQTICQNGPRIAEKLIAAYSQQSSPLTFEIFSHELKNQLEKEYQRQLQEQLSEKNEEIAKLKQYISDCERKLYQLELESKTKEQIFEERLKSKDLEKESEIKQKELVEKYADRLHSQLESNLNAIRESLVGDGRLSHRTSIPSGIASNIVVQRKQEGIIQHTFSINSELNKAFTLQRNKVLVFLAGKIANGDARFELYYNRVKNQLEEPLENMNLQGLSELLGPGEKALLNIIAEETATILRNRIQEVNKITSVLPYMKKKIVLFEQQMNLSVDQEPMTAKLSQ